jgi:hypothetical protein
MNERLHARPLRDCDRAGPPGFGPHELRFERIESRFFRAFSVSPRASLGQGSCFTEWRAAEGWKARYALVERLSPHISIDFRNVKAVPGIPGTGLPFSPAPPSCAPTSALQGASKGLLCFMVCLGSRLPLLNENRQPQSQHSVCIQIGACLSSRTHVYWPSRSLSRELERMRALFLVMMYVT